MKKWALVFVTILVIAVLTACTEESTEGTNNTTDGQTINYEPGNIEELQATIAQEHLSTLYDIICAVLMF